MSMTPQDYIRHANGVFVVEKFEHDSVTAVRLDDLLRDGTKARRVEFRNGASLLSQAKAWGQPLSFSAGAVVEVTTTDAVRFHMVNVVPQAGTKRESDYKRVLSLLFPPVGLTGTFGISERTL